MRQISIVEKVGVFAENKDVARDIRLDDIAPALEQGDSVVLDFTGVDAATQSFIHALVSDMLRQHGNEVLDRLLFKGCNDNIKKIVGIVTDYLQDGFGDD